MKYIHEGTVKKPELWEQLIDYTSNITGIKFRFIYYDDSRMIYMKAYKETWKWKRVDVFDYGATPEELVDALTTETWKWKRVYVFDYGASPEELVDALTMVIKEYEKRECS